MESREEITGSYRPGMVIGSKFVLLRLIAEGGMGAVFEAKDELIQRHVAIKLLRDDVLRDAETVARFRREAALAASIQHPNVVSILEMGQRHDGSFYIVQELLRGDTLRDHMERHGRFTVDEALEIALPLMGALIAAHNHGVIHRDIKPENIILARSSSAELLPKLIDFGIAKGYQVQDGQETAPGKILGTPRYMSPQQISADQPLDARTDVWSLGVVLYELLSGTYPHGARGEAPQLIVGRIVGERPRPIRSVLPDVPERLAAILDRVIEPDLDRRIPSVQALRDEILAFINRRSILMMTGDEATPPDPLRMPPGLPEVPSLLGSALPAPAAHPRDPSAAEAASDQPPHFDDELAHGDRPPPSTSRTALYVQPTVARAERDQHVELAERALSLNQLHEAITSAARALMAGPDNDATAGRMWVVQAIAHRWLGAYEPCHRCAREAAACVERASGTWYTALGHAAIAAGHLDRGDALLEILDEVQSVEIVEGQVHLHAILLCRLAIHMLRAGMLDQTHQLLRRAHDILGGDAHAEPVARAWLDVTRADLARRRGDFVTYLRRADSAMEAFTVAADVRNSCLQRASVGDAYLQLGAYRHAHTVLCEALDVATPMQLDFVAPLQVNLGFVQAQLGDLDTAIATEEAALQRCTRPSARRTAGAAQTHLANFHAQRNDIPRAITHAEDALLSLDSSAPQRPCALATLAQLLLTQKQTARALAIASEAIALLERLGGAADGDSLVRTVHALALRAAGREADGRAEIARGRARLLERAAQIEDPAWRRTFLEGVQDNARLLSLAGQWLGDDAGGAAPGG